MAASYEVGSIPKGVSTHMNAKRESHIHQGEERIGKTGRERDARGEIESHDQNSRLKELVH